MSVIVKGMEMPKDCNKCPMTVDGYCRVIGYPNGDAIIKHYKPLWCPLVDFPLEQGEKIVKVQKKINSTVSWSITIVGTWEEEHESERVFIANQKAAREDRVDVQRER